jgi:Uma2 family endonuclease
MRSVLASALSSLEQYSIFSRLSIEIEGKEYIPDISIYSKRKIDLIHDIVIMTEMPLLAIEIFSNHEQELIEVYLNAGIQSCWLVTPITRTVTVFHEIGKPKRFVDQVVVDDKLNISLPLSEIFPF